MSGRRRQSRWEQTAKNAWSLINPPVFEREFIKAMGQWWLRSRGFKAQAMVGPFRVDFVSEDRRLLFGSPLYQIILIDNTTKPGDIVRQQEDSQRQTIRDDYLYRKGFAVLHVDAVDILRDPQGTYEMVKDWSHDPSDFYDRHFGET